MATAAAAAASAYVGWRLLFRRRRRPLDLLRDLKTPLPASLEILTPEQVEAEAVEALALAWSGSASTDPEQGFDWMLGPDLRGKWEDPERLRLLQWCHRFFYTICRAAAPGTVMLAARGPDGKVAGAVGVVPYEGGLPGALGELYAFIYTLARLVPFHGWGMLAGNAGTRFLATNPFVQAAHEHAIGNEGKKPHLYIGPVGVVPSMQGRGVTSVMMRHVNAWADELGWCCYLECSGERNPLVYKRYGYEDVGGPDADLSGSPDLKHGPLRCIPSTFKCPDGQDFLPPFWSMVRRPAAAAAERT